MLGFKWIHIVYVSEYKNMFLHKLYIVLTTEIQGTHDIHRLSVTEGRLLLYSNSVADSGANGVLEHSLAWLLSKIDLLQVILVTMSQN